MLLFMYLFILFVNLKFNLFSLCLKSADVLALDWWYSWIIWFLIFKDVLIYLICRERLDRRWTRCLCLWKEIRSSLVQFSPELWSFCCGCTLVDVSELACNFPSGVAPGVVLRLRTTLLSPVCRTFQHFQLSQKVRRRMGREVLFFPAWWIHG